MGDFMGSMVIGELILVLLIILILFGAKRLPGIGRALGKAVHEFKKASRGLEDGASSSRKDEGGKKG